MLQEDKDVLQVWKYTLPEIMLGLVVILFLSFGIRGLFSWSSFRLSAWGSAFGPLGEILVLLFLLGFLFLVFGMVLMQEKD
jgi:hypothetical protein